MRDIKYDNMPLTLPLAALRTLECCMRMVRDSVVLSPSDLMRFQGCTHATALDVRYLCGEEGLEPEPDSDEARLLQKHGDTHEATLLEELSRNGRMVTVINRDGSFEDAAAATRAALQRGDDYVYQAALGLDGVWQGYSDFLERVDRPSNLGAFSYEVIDTKLKRSPDAKHLLQLAVYSDAIEEIQGAPPKRAHLVLGDGSRQSFLLIDYAAYARRLKDRLEGFVAAPTETRPAPVAACTLCRWRTHCDGEWDREDSLVLVAGITGSQRLKLERASVHTLSRLADFSNSVPHLATPTLAKLKTQAALQRARRAGGPPSFSLRPHQRGLGFDLFPTPARGDLFFDMEGDPFVDPEGLEYLFGIYQRDRSFKSVWAHDRQQEREATGSVLRFFIEHLDSHPNAHIFHYNHYEVTALKRLATRHGVGEEILDQLLRQERFVDLYRIVRQTLFASEPGYALKDLEAFYMKHRTEALTTAGDSILAYETWRDNPDPAILEEICAYNQADCRSTKMLRDWLVGAVRPPGMPWPQTARSEALSVNQIEAEENEAEADREDLRQRIDARRADWGDRVADLLFEITWFHKRENKPQWWLHFDRAKMASQELVDDLESLGGLQAIEPPRDVKRSLGRRYSFPLQETKLHAGAKIAIRENRKNIGLLDLDPEARTVDLKFSATGDEPPDTLDVIPGGPRDTKVLAGAVRRVIESVLAGSSRYQAVVDVVFRNRPRLKGIKPGKPVIGTGDIVEETIAAVDRLQLGALPIQGPPGTGKTWISSHVILHLAQRGCRVGVSSNSHKAIDKLLSEVRKRAKENGIPLPIIHKIGGPEEHHDTPDGIETTSDNKDSRLNSYQVVGGTAWLFARPESDQQFDYLFVDEGGQVTLANLIAMGTAARNIVLVGDPMQLAQPTQGAHPGETGLSALEYVLDGRRTIPPDRGIFLPTSWRMHPAICRFISRQVYEGRLSSDQAAANQRVLLSGSHSFLKPTGLVFRDVPHDGNSQSSHEEGEEIKAAYDYLVGQRFVDRAGKIRPMTKDDVLVVTPYNAQANLLRGLLPHGARVGTIDKFQGQEAPVSLISMATSSSEELPRNIAFLFSVNRLNVAISRAQALAVVFASSRLLDTPCRSIDDLRLVNTLCAAKEYAGTV